MSNILCLETYRKTRTIQLIESKINPNEPKLAFNRAVYALYARFGKHLPGHFKSAWARVSLEPYSLGCTHNIKWTKKGRSKIWNSPIPVPMNITPDSCLIGSAVKIGGTDPLAWLDMKYRISWEHIKTRQKKLLEIHTRSDLIAHDDYIAVLDKQYHKIIIYVNDLSPDANRIWEPGAPSNARRIKAYKKLKSLGFSVKLIRQRVSTKVRRAA